MTTTSRNKIVCICGHEGSLKLEENNQPFSSPWETYSLEGFSGRNLTIESASMPTNLIAELEPTCPECGQAGKVKFA